MLYRDGDAGRELTSVDGDRTWRGDFMRDYGRVIHSASFRRLQGKTQVFPGHESDFFRNRLTHSLEVAQIAEGIVDRLNVQCDELRAEPINSRLCATAALLHDLGHPPFGHNGERALDAKMREYGGFEGNAQSLRIVTRLESKVVYGGVRYGLNLTYRTLAAILKYDRPIPASRNVGAKLCKGYYTSEAELVRTVKAQVARGARRLAPGDFKTIECQLMDVADDIAYSTFDLEDALKAGFVSPASILASSKSLIGEVAAKVSDELERPVTSEDVLEVFQILFEDLFDRDALVAGPMSDASVEFDVKERALEILAAGERASNSFVHSGTLRTKLSSKLVKDAIDSVKMDWNAQVPALSKVHLDDDARLRVEVLKQFVYAATISTPRVKLQEYRGTRIVSGIFDALTEPKGNMLMPDDVRAAYDGAVDPSARMRVACDFVAGMTDRYAVEFYSRLNSDAVSMFKML